MDTPTLAFDDVIGILRHAEGTLCEISIAPEVTQVEWSNVVHFDGIVGDVDDNAASGGVLLRILASPGVRAGWIDLSRASFRSATLDADDEPPQTLTLWQRGIRLQLQLWPQGTIRNSHAGAADASDDDVPF